MTRPPDTLEAQVERAWCALCEQAHGRRLRFYLTSDGHLKSGLGEGEEVGTYTRAVSLADFRGDVFDSYANLRRAVHGHR